MSETSKALVAPATTDLFDRRDEIHRRILGSGIPQLPRLASCLAILRTAKEASGAELCSAVFAVEDDLDLFNEGSLEDPAREEIIACLQPARRELRTRARNWKLGAAAAAIGAISLVLQVLGATIPLATLVVCALAVCGAGSVAGASTMRVGQALEAVGVMIERFRPTRAPQQISSGRASESLP